MTLKCARNDCPLGKEGKCVDGLHPSWPTCPKNKGTASTTSTTFGGVSLEDHRRAVEQFLIFTGQYDTGGLEK